MSDFAQVEKWLQGKNVVQEIFKNDVMKSFKIFADLVSDSKHGKIFKKYKKVSPVEFVYAAVFIFVHKDANSLAQLASGILDMFDHVRTVHRDVRMNNRVQKSFTIFISDWKNKNGAEDAGVSSSGVGDKRKRTATIKKKKIVGDMNVDSDEDDEDDDDDDYAAPKTKKKVSQKSATPKATIIPDKTPSSSKIKAEPSHTSIPAQKSDRLAAIRKTKEVIAQNQAVLPQENLDAGSWAIFPPDASLPSSKVASTASANPQMLPSPAQVFLNGPPAQSPVLPSWNPNGPVPLTGSSNSSADMPLWNQFPNTNSNLNGTFSGPNDNPRGMPTAPPSAPIVPSNTQRDRERDRERDRDRRGSYDDRDRDSRRYDHRRDSGYRPRPQEDRDGGWSGSRRR